MGAERLAVEAGDGDKLLQRLMFFGHPGNSPAHQIRMASHELVNPLQLRFVLERPAEMRVNLRDLFRREVFYVDLGPDVEGRLVGILDQKMSFGGVAENESEVSELRMDRPAVVPGAHQTEDVGIVIELEKPVDLVHEPDNRSGKSVPEEKIL